jgi:hypothetical protein
MQAKKKFMTFVGIVMMLVVACAPVASRSYPFDVRDGGKSKVVYVAPVIVLADGIGAITCQGRPEQIRILSADNQVLGKIPVSNAIPGEDGWTATFPLFDSLQALFRPGTTYKVNCWGVNGTGGPAMSFRVYYVWSQAEEDGFVRP